MNKKEETTSFMIRFTQKVYQDESGESQVQWRGNIRHVQGGDEKRFADFSKAMEFMQSKLADLTIKSMEDKPAEEQRGVLSKSFGLWKKMAVDYPMKVLEAIKDPKAQVEQIQEQLQEQVSQVGQNIESELNQWRGASKSDIAELIKSIDALSKDVKEMKEKIDKGF